MERPECGSAEGINQPTSALLTIYTPTFNRAVLLLRVYNSLLRQTSKDFLWLIVDDGSTDDTHALVEEWIKNDNGFEIHYEYKVNEGVHSARNLAYRLCKTRLILGIDSDDWLANDAVETIIDVWKRHEGKGNFAGIIAKCISSSGEAISANWPSQTKYASLQDFVYRYKCTSDRSTVMRTDIIQAVEPAPVFPGEKLVGEDYQ